jgi:NADPH2:quinone reductase
MRAALYRTMGSSKVLSVEEIETPEPGPGEVRARISCSGVNPIDWKRRSDTPVPPSDLFQVPNFDGSGVIDAVGAGVTSYRPGDRVWLYLAAADNRYGTAAEYSVVRSERAVLLPDNASDQLGASLGAPALTAAYCLGGNADALSGASVLIAGGAGAVGHFAIELAKQAGAQVVTTVSSEEKAVLARAAGADLVVDYRDARAAAEIRSFAPRIDRIVEVALGANLDLDMSISTQGTVIVVYSTDDSEPAIPTLRLMIANVTVEYVLLYTAPKLKLAAAVAWTSAAVKAGALSELPAHRFSLDEVAAAHDAVERHAVGKVFVMPG